MPQSPRKRDALSAREYVGYALGDTASNLFFQTFNIFLTFYYVDVWGLLPAAVSTMMLWVRLFDAVNDPVMGVIADRTRSRWGKFRPYLLWGAVPYGVCGYLLFANPDLEYNGKLVYAYITYTLMMVAYTVINVPYSSLLGVISPSPRTRGVASSFRFVGAFGGAFLVSLLVRPLVQELGGDDEVRGFQLTMAIFAGLSIAMFVGCFATTHERVTPPPRQKSTIKTDLHDIRRNWPWIMLLLASIFSTTFIAMRSGSTLFYFKYVVGADTTPLITLGRLSLDQATVFLTSNSLCQMLGALCLGFVVRAADKRTLATVLSVITAICYASFYYLPTDSYGLLLLVNGVGSLCMGPTSALVWAMYGDVADYGEWKFGRRATGLVYSASLFALKTGMLAGGVLLPWFLHFYGFERDVEQTSRSILGITIAFSLAPGVFAILKAVFLWIYPLSQRQMDQIEQDLAARRSGGDGSAAAPHTSGSGTD